MSGFDAIKKLHSLDSSASKIPIIFLTADESEGAEREGLQLGAMDFIRKPVVRWSMRFTEALLETIA
jgi:DNA-binding response OmpR family regulator